MIRWVLLSTFATGLFYGLYVALLRRDRWLQLSRVYLMCALAFSLVFPLVRLPRVLASTTPVAGLFAATGGEVTVVADGAAGGGVDVPVWVYGIGLALSMAVLLVQAVVKTWAVVRLRRHNSVYGRCDGFRIPHGASLILTPDDTAPYSFFNQIVVGASDLSESELRCVLAHESLHVRRVHSVDLLAMRLMCCVAWFNPFAWLMTRELLAVHEFQADMASLGDCRREDYLRLLYRQAIGTGYGHITNNFNSINIKKRIVMMNKTKTRFGAWKMLAALPVAALLMVVGCNPADSPMEAATGADQSVEKVGAGAPGMASDGEVFEVVEQDPVFPGGVEAMYRYIAENLRYPQQAVEANVQGRVFLDFIVEKDGSISSPRVLRGIGNGCDDEALRVVEAMPKWTPGKQGGKAARVRYTLPINFKLQ